MSIIDLRPAPRILTHDAAPRLAATLSSIWLTLGLAVFAVAQQIAGHLDCDVSWFITFAEKYVDGAVPYVDITDPNPPASFLFFAPAVLLARALKLHVESAATAFIFSCALLSLALCAMILRHGAKRSREDWGLVLNAAIFLLAIAPELVFGEREHLALLAIAPMLASLVVHGEGGGAPAWLKALAGGLAGVAVCFKPFFFLPVALPALALAWRARSPRLLFSVEVISAALVSGFYAFATAALFPAYISQALPVVADVYQPAHEEYLKLALNSVAPFNAVLLATLVLAATRFYAGPPVAPGFVAPASARVCFYASCGFLITFFLQGKGWINHAYPGIVLALAAWIFFVLDRHPPAVAVREGRLFKFIFLPVFIACPMLFGAIKVMGDIEEHPGLRAAIARIAPDHPRLIAMARQLDYGHPVTRQLDGVWVGRPNALFTASFAAYLLGQTQDPVRRARLGDYRRRDLAGFTQDVREGHPDVIIVEDAMTREWVVKQPESAASLDGYQKAAEVGEIELWSRSVPVDAVAPLQPKP